MLFVEFVLVLLSVAVGTVMVIVILKKMLEFPIFEMRLLLLVSILILIFWAGYIPLTILSSPNMSSKVGIFCFRISVALGYVATLSLSLTLFYPDYRLNFHSILTIGMLTILSFGTAIHNSLTTSVRVKDGIIIVETTEIGVFLMMLNIVVLIMMLLRRIHVIRFLTKKNPLFLSGRLLVVNAILISIVLFILFLARLLPHTEIPGLLWLLPASLALLVLIYSLSMEEGIFFITDSKLRAVVFLLRESGLVLYGTHFVHDLPRDGGIASLLTVLNINLTDLVKSSQDLEEIHFGDKTLLIANGSQVSLVMMVDRSNLVVKSIARYFVRCFEKEFSETIEQITKVAVVRKSAFRSAEKMVHRISKFIPP